MKEEIIRKFRFDSIDKDLFLLDDINQFPKHDTLVKRNHSLNVICLHGKIEVSINLKQYTFLAPCFVFIRSGVVSQIFDVSEDFRGLFMGMSKNFGKKLEFSLQQTMPLMFYFDHYPSTPLNNEEVKLLTYCFRILRMVVKQESNPYRTEIVKHLMQAFFYSTNMIFQKYITTEKKSKSRQEEIFEDFMICVQKYFREERGLEFYADKLSITPKYLSSVIKSVSLKSANEWIDEHVILEAKVLLKTTRMTVQQIGDELSFTDQSFFGRYFKKHVGLSPKKFRESLG